ncbi:MAG: hypothetical protein NDJ89_12710 [Oligoflexia bacterium]|nr:hypothetical protein [Oligoflexia bacterium]
MKKYLGLILAIGLSACNSNDSQRLSFSDPNVNTPPVAKETPVPEPTATSKPTPVPTVTPSPVPSPTPSPTPTTPVNQVYTGPAEVAKYVQKFIDDAKMQGVDVLPDMASPKLQIQLGSLDSYGASVIGLCETSANLRRVTLDPDFWDSVSETQRELLAHHELGHCVLYRAHKSTLLSTGAYASIMYPIIMGSSTYLNNYDYYQQELFAQAARQAGEVNASTVHVCDLNELM